MNNSDAPVSQFQILGDIFLSPGKAFRHLQTNPTIALPLFLMLVLMVAFLFYYFSKVDFSWLVEQTVQAEAGDKSKAEMDQVRQGMELLGKNGMMGFGIIGILIMIPLIYVLQAAYYSLVSNIRGDGIKFKAWFSFICWSSIPAIVAILASFVTLFLNEDGQILQQSVNPISLNALFFDLPPIKGMGALLASINLASVWSLVVSVIGYAKWTHTTNATATSIVWAPWVVVYGVWALIAM